MQAAFAKHGLSVVQMPQVIEGRLHMRTLLLHSSGQSLECGDLAADVDTGNPQQMGSAITYFRRYALAAISQTVADEDDDGNAATRTQSRPTRNSRPAPKAKAPMLSADDMEFTDRVRRSIESATNDEDFKMIYTMIQERSLPESTLTSLRTAVSARKKFLKDQEKNDATN